MVSQRVAGVPPVVATGEPEGWEIIFCVYLMISLQTSAFLSIQESESTTSKGESLTTNFSQHQDWNSAPGWKNQLNKLRLLTQPLLLFSLIVPGLNLFPNEHLLLGFNDLIGVINQVLSYFSTG